MSEWPPEGTMFFGLNLVEGEAGVFVYPDGSVGVTQTLELREEDLPRLRLAIREAVDEAMSSGHICGPVYAGDHMASKINNAGGSEWLVRGSVARIRQFHALEGPGGPGACTCCGLPFSQLGSRHCDQC